MTQSNQTALRRTPAGPGPRHRRFHDLLGVLAACAVLALALVPGRPVASERDIFTVRDVPVDATAASASAARDQALAQGQIAAFERLTRRIVLASDRERLPDMGPDAINELVRDFEVANEKTSAVRYLANMTVRFKDDAVRAFLRGLGVGFAETRSKPLLVLPIYEVAGALSLWDEPNPWREAWAKLPPSDGLVPLVLPRGDLQDIASIGAEQAVRGDDKRLAEIAKRYGAADVLIARAAMRFTETPEAQGGGGARLEVIVSRFGTIQLEQTRVKSFYPEPGETLPGLLQRAADAVARQIEENWKRNNRLRFDTGDELTVEVPLDSLGQWVEIRQRLGEVAFIRRSDLVFLTRSAAMLRLNFIGGEEQLRLALAQNDLVLDRGTTAWELRLGAGAGGQGNNPTNGRGSAQP